MTQLATSRTGWTIPATDNKSLLLRLVGKHCGVHPYERLGVCDTEREYEPHALFIHLLHTELGMPAEEIAAHIQSLRCQMSVTTVTYVLDDVRDVKAHEAEFAESARIIRTAFARLRTPA